MKAKSIKIVSIITCILMILYAIIPNIAYALETGKPELKLTTDKTTVKRGEEVILTLSLNTNSNKSVSTIQSYINYDSNIFEVSKITRGIKNILTQEEQDSGRETESYMANTDIPGEINVIYTVSKSFEYNGTVCQIVLKAKQDAQIGKTDFIINAEEHYPVSGGSDTGGGHKPIESTIINSSVEIIAPLESISLTSTSNELWVGETAQLTVDYKPTDTTKKGVTYKSSDDKIATVSANGIVTAVGKGIAKIEAIGANNITSSINITVKQPITGVSLDKTVLELERGETATIVASISPENNDGDRTITWKSSNDQVAIVEGGKVTAIGKGSADITVTTSNGLTAVCKVTVGVPLKSISFKDDVTSKILNKGEEFKLEVVYNPADTDADKTITWSSTDTSVATVENGKVKAIGGGETEIKATAVNGLEAICKVKVEVPLNSISIKNETSIQFGQTEKLIVTYDPIDTTADKTIAWSSQNENIVKISTDGTIEGVGVGETTITAKGSNGQEVTCKVIVLPVELNSISIIEQNITLNKGENKTLSVKFNPENTTDDKTITWSSDNEQVVTVNAEGLITAVGAGKATIMATVGEKTDTTEVEVKVPLESISLNETEKTLIKGESLQLNVTYNPDDTTANKNVTWTSTDTSVAEVSSDGIVTAKGRGTAYIKAKVEDKEISCKIDVLVPLTEIEINKTNLELLKGQNDKLTVKLIPEDTTYTGTIEWSSSDESVVTVDKNGNINGLKEGTALITAKAIENGKEVISTTEVTVKEIPLDSIEIDISNFDLEIGKTEKLNIICNPENTTDNINIEWSSSNEEVATIDQNGNIKALSVGTTVITAKVGEKTASVEVTVKAIPITSIEINAPVKVLIGGTFDVQITVNPENATYNMSDIKIISSNSDVLFVNEDGTIFAKGLGKAILTVETKNGIKTQTEIEVVDSTIDYPEEDPTDDLENNEENDNKPNEEDKTEQQNPIDDSENEKQEENNSNSPKTGDLKIEVLITLMIISVIGIVIILFRKLKK